MTIQTLIVRDCLVDECILTICWECTVERTYLEMKSDIFWNFTRFRGNLLVPSSRVKGQVVVLNA